MSSERAGLASEELPNAEQGIYISATGAVDALCIVPALTIVANDEGADGESTGVALGPTGDILDPAVCPALRTGTTLATLLSNCSMGNRRCACTILSMPSSR